MSDDYLDQVRELMREQIPFNKFLGLECTDLRPGFASLVLPFRQELVGDPWRPALHGGTISMLADTAGGAAVFTAAEPGDRVSTIDLRVDYLRPGALTAIHADATVVRVGNRVGVARIQVWQDAEVEGQPRRLIAEATGVYSVRRQ